MDEEKYFLEKLKTGDAESFEKLVTMFQKKVYNVALRMSGNPEDALEISQEAFLKIYKSVKNFRGESSLSTWVYKITTNICIDELRKQKNKNILYIDEKTKNEDGEYYHEIEDHSMLPNEVAEKNELRKTVTYAISSLSEDYRTVIILRDLQGLSYDEISKITGCPEGTVKSRINRARSSLADILKRKKELLEGYLRQK